MRTLPSGTVTFLFTDIEGSTKRWESYPQQMRSALSKHDAILRSCIEDYGGYVFKTVGDAFCAAFSSPHSALNSALELQRDLNKAEWPPEIGEVRVRAALHTGAVEEQGGDYFGQPVNRVARLLSAGHGAQTLLSRAIQELVCDNLPVEVQLADLGEHRLKDLIRPERIFQLQADGLPAQFPPLHTLDSHPNNLPEQLTPFIGREKEVAAVVGVLRRTEVRLLTLAGPGGTGKTRLALQVAADLLDDFADGVWFVNLAPIMDPQLVIPTVAQTFGVKELGSTPLTETVRSYLKARHLLLMLDNFEQVAEAASHITDLLKGAPGVKVLVTSRARLQVTGEHEYSVPALQLPDKQHLPPLDRLTQYEAVRLFIDRATALKPDFEVTNENAPAVAEICHRLDGLPLAIELAAARITILSPQGILQRLVSRLKLLTGGSKDSAARQQTLRNAIEWSYDLLSEEEKKLFRRLAVFQGGRSLEAIEAVCNAYGDLQVDTLDGVQSLVDKSLLKQVEDAGGEPRLWMLETIHEYAREKLAASAEEDALCRLHAKYFLVLAQQASPHILAGGSIEWYTRLTDEYHNIRAVLAWSLNADLDLGLELAGALFLFWFVRGPYRETMDWLEVALRASEGQRTPARAHALVSAAWVARAMALHDRAREVAEESIALAKAFGDDVSVARGLKVVGQVAMGKGDFQRAADALEEALALGGEGDGGAGVLVFLGEMARLRGDYLAAEQYYRECEVLYRQMGNTLMLGVVQTNRGYVANHLHDYASARAFLLEALTLCRPVMYPPTAVGIVLGLAGVVGGEGAVWRGAVLFGAVTGLLSSLEIPLEQADRVEYEQYGADLRAHLSETEWEQAQAQGRVMSLEEAVAYALEEDATPR